MDEELEEFRKFCNELSPEMRYKIIEALFLENEETLNTKYTEKELQEIYSNIGKLNELGHFKEAREKLLEIAFEDGE